MFYINENSIQYSSNILTSVTFHQFYFLATFFQFVTCGYHGETFSCQWYRLSQNLKVLSKSSYHRILQDQEYSWNSASWFFRISFFVISIRLFIYMCLSNPEGLTNQTAEIWNNRPSFPGKLVREGFFLLVYKLRINPGLNIDFVIMTSIGVILVAVMTMKSGVVVLADKRWTTVTNLEYY